MNRQIDEVERAEKGFNPFNKREKVRQAWEKVTGQLYAYLTAEMKTQAITHLQRRDLLREAAGQFRKTTTLALRRLDQMQAAFSQEAADLEKTWKEMAASSPSVNGKVYFEAEPPSSQGTVTQEYFQLLKQARWPEEPVTGWADDQKETAAMREVLKTLEPLRAELTRDEGRSAFDTRPGAQAARGHDPDAVLGSAELRARAFLAPLRDQTHIADKASDSDVDTVVQASEPRLSVSAAQVSDRLAGVEGADPLPPTWPLWTCPRERTSRLPFSGSPSGWGTACTCGAGSSTARTRTGC